MNIGITGHQKLEDETTWAWVKQELQSIAKEHPDAVAVSSLAAGTDQLFAEVMLANNNKLTVVIPSKKYEETFDDSTIEKYRELLKKADETIQLEFSEPSEEAYYEAGKKVADQSNLIIAVWNAQPAQGLGGTADIVKYAKINKKWILHINPITRKVTEL